MTTQNINIASDLECLHFWKLLKKLQFQRNMFFLTAGFNLHLQQNKKKRGKSKYLLYVIVDILKNGEIIPAKVVYVRNRNNCKEYLCLISTNVNLNENGIIRI